MPFTSMFYELRRHLEKLGFNLDVTRRALSLGAQDGTTGWYAKTFAETTIRMIVIPKGAQFLAVSMGVFVGYDCTGLTDTAVAEGDEVLDGNHNYYIIETVQTHLLSDSAVMYECGMKGPMQLHPLAVFEQVEQITEGGFESEGTGWTRSGNTSIEHVPYTGAHSAGFWTTDPAWGGPDTMEQTLTTPRAVEDIISATFWLYGFTSFSPPGGSQVKVTVTYTDATTSTGVFEVTLDHVWQQFDFKSTLTPGKAMSKIKIEAWGSLMAVINPSVPREYVDDVSILAYVHYASGSWDYGPFDEWWLHWDKFGFSNHVTYRQLHLSTQDTVTGWYGKYYTESQEHMVIIPKAMRPEVVSMGLMPNYELNAYCTFDIYEGDMILHGTTYYVVKTVTPVYVGTKLAMFNVELERIKLGGFA